MPDTHAEGLPPHPEHGSAIPNQPGYVVGECGHRVAASEWRAGFRQCERCPNPRQPGLDRWRDPETGFPTDEYFNAVTIALTEAGVTVDDQWRDEPWDFTYELGDGCRKGYAALYIGWRVAEQSEPLKGEWAGLPSYCGWHWVPYSNASKALGDFAEELPVDLLAEPKAVAKAVAELVNGGAQ